MVPHGLNFEASVTGDYKICFDNSMSRWTAKVVVLDIVVGQDEQLHMSLLEKGNEVPAPELTAKKVQMLAMKDILGGEWTCRESLLILYLSFDLFIRYHA